MKCPFCAEEIQDAAILCRYCGARKEGNEWRAPEAFSLESPRRKGGFTIKTAGVLFVLSGLFELLYVTSDIALLSAVRSGLTAIGYHCFFVGLFVSMGAGLLVGQRWGYDLVFAGTLFYTFDRLLLVIDRETRHAYLTISGVTEPVKTLIDKVMLDQLVIITTLTTIACWWGFALYVYLRRDYFRNRETQPKA